MNGKLEMDKSALEMFINNSIDELGSPIDWGQVDFNNFYSWFINRSEFGSRLLLEVYEIKEYDTHFLYIAHVLNPDDLTPIFISIENRNWKLAFSVNYNEAQYHKGDILTVFPKALHLNEINREEKKKDLFYIDSKSLISFDQDKLIKANFGQDVLEELYNQFGSLEYAAELIVDFLQTSLKQEIEEMVVTTDEEMEKNRRELQNKLEQQQTEFEHDYKLKHEEFVKKQDDLNKKIHEISTKEQLQRTKESQLNESEKYLEEIEDYIIKERDRLENEKVELNKQFNKLNLTTPSFISDETLEDYGGSDDTANIETVYWEDEPDIIGTLQGALHKQQNLQYERDVIEGFVGALKTDQLIILHGSSGTGKSSLVNNFTKIIQNAKTHMIRVQPSWTDKQDLFGFFNPLDMQYISTDFLDALIDAYNNPNELHIICLDEMNLAHVEYYFSELLSAREEENSYITLYPQHFEQLAQKIIQPYLKENENGFLRLNEDKIANVENLSERLKLQNCFDLLYLYPSKLYLPDNVRFVGTMNLDETVKGLSPKTIDRSFVIEIEQPEHEGSLYEELEGIKHLNLINIDINDNLNVENIDYETRTAAVNLNQELMELNATLNRRALDQIGLFGEAVHSYNKLDLILRGKILPRIQTSKNEQAEKDLMNLSSYNFVSDKTKRKINKILNSGRMLSYWR